ncbi:MAG: hypothetical protein ACREAR_03945 [Nitrosotalea sp.]
MVDAGTLLQVDGTIIAGVLILLTIGHFKNKPWGEEVDFGPDNKPKVTPYSAVFMIVIPFAISAIAILLEDVLIYPTTLFTLFLKSTLQSLGTISAIFGFAYLIGVLLWLVKPFKNRRKFSWPGHKNIGNSSEF